MCVPSSAGESVQLPRTLFPPTAHHCRLPGTLSIHDDKVHITHFPVLSLYSSYRLVLLFFLDVKLEDLKDWKSHNFEQLRALQPE